MLENKYLIRNVLIGMIIVTGGVLGIYFGVFYNSNSDDNGNGNDEEIVVLTINGRTQSKNFTLQEIQNMASIEGYGGYKKSTGTIVGPSLYKGIDLLSLLDQVSGVGLDEELVVIASDGWTVRYSYNMISAQVTAYDNLTGTNLGLKEFQVILAYERDGEKLPNDEGPLRIAYLSGQGYLSDGNLWSKLVRTLEVSSAVSWTVYMYGLTNDSLDKTSFLASMFSGEENHSAFYVLEEGIRNNTYQGIPLWMLISIIDGELPESTHYTFNETLALLGYQIELINKREESVILDIADVIYNNNVILAASKNSIFFEGFDAPLKLVGEGLDSVQMISGITEIWIRFS